MKKALLFLTLAVVIGLASCKKCANCNCAGDISFEFHDSITVAEREELENTWTTAYETDYPDEELEICEKRKDFDDEVTTYEDKTKTYEEHQTIHGDEYHVMYVYTCACEE